jgi:hypothetical protein
MRLLADENFNGVVVRAVLARCPGLDLVRVQDVGLSGAADPDVLAWAAANDRIVLTHDYRTMPDDARARLLAGLPMPGLFVFRGMTIGDMIDELAIAVACSAHDEWADQIKHFPV